MSEALASETFPEPPFKVAVSSCLLGQEVRWDKGHKHDRFVTDMLGAYVEFVPVCPEVAIGLGIPRETIHLVREDDGIHLRGTRSRTDHSDAMRAFARQRAEELKAEGIIGYILKKDSPSCGLFRVRVHEPPREGKAAGSPTRDGRGLYAEVLAEVMPDLPMEEDGRLNDARLRENFVERLFAYHRLTRFLSGPWTIGDLVAFHTAEKLLLMAHDPATYKSLGQLVADARHRDRDDLAAAYRAGFMAGMAKLATPGRQTNVLQHMAGYFKKDLSTAERAELSDLISDYRAGLVPLVVPVTLIRHFVRRFGVGYLAGQSYLEPHPRELMLRNHV